MIEELKELNEKFYELYARLDRYIEKMSEEQVRSMQEKMEEQYELEYKLLFLKNCAETEREIEWLKAKNDILFPYRWKTKIFRRKRQNYAQTLLDEDVRQETNKIFAKFEAKLSAGQEEWGKMPAEPAEEAQEANPTGEEEENVSADETDRSEEKEEREEAFAKPVEEAQEANPTGEEEEKVSADETDRSEEDDGIDAEYEIT